MNALDVFADARPDVDGLDPAMRAAIADELFGEGTAPVEREPAASVAVVQRQASGRVGAPWLVFAAAAAVVGLVAGLAAVAGDRDVEAPAAPPTEMPAAPVEPLRLLPADPAPYVFAGSVRQRWDDPVGPYVVLARPDGAGGYSEPIWVSRSPRDEVVQELLGPAVEFEAGGRRLQFREDVSTGYRLVVLDAGDGTDVALVSFRQGPTGTFRDELAALAVGIDLTASELVVDPPDGYEVAATGTFAQETLRSLEVQRDGAPFASVATSVGADANFPIFNMGERIEPVAVRGTAGWLTFSTWQALDGPWQQPRLIWEERPGQWVQVSGADAITADELRAFAASLVEVDATTYAAVVDEEAVPTGPDPAEVVPTTSVAVTASTAPSPVPATTAPQTAPAGTVLVVNGTRTPGIAGRASRVLEESGVDVIEPTDATGDEFRSSVLYVRPGAEVLGSWVTSRFVGAHAVTTIDELDQDRIVGGVRDADVVLVLGVDAVPLLTTPIVFGDNVVLGAADVLSSRGYLVDAELGRPLVDLIPHIELVLAETRPNVVVVHIGTNGPIRREDLDRLLEVTADVPNVILVNAHADREWIGTNNALVAEADRPDDNIYPIDWNALADDCPGDCFAADDLHLTETGATYFADAIGEITGY